ncbi:hypothetical protein RP20_CCG009872 [Aedes albopictus]|nr:hypothetical protein RP20_CCG009872 [Aedes albopictus]
MDLPPVAKLHWLGDRSWHSVPPKIDNRIKNSFSAGCNSAALRRSVAELLRVSYPNFAHRFSDGSLSHLGVGIGVSGDIPPVSMSLPPQCSVFSAEAAAAFIAATTPSDRPILVLTDSASVISALQSDTPTHPWIQGILMNAPADTVFTWIPGHCGVPGNEKADHLAGSGHTRERHTDRIPLMDLKRWIKSSCRQYWGNLWSQSRTAFLRKIKDTVEPWTDLPVLKDQRVISRLRTGHTLLSHNMGGGPFRKECEVCHIPATVEHVLCVCPIYEGQRRLHNIAGNIGEVLRDDPDTIKTLFKFLHDCNLYELI